MTVECSALNGISMSLYVLKEEGGRERKEREDREGGGEREEILRDHHRIGSRKFLSCRSW